MEKQSKQSVENLEITKYLLDKSTLEFIKKRVKNYIIIGIDEKGMQYKIDDQVSTFPFCINSEIKILISDAIDQYTNIINEIKNS